ncbi:MAG: FecR family protein [Mariprofundus sp.]
MFSSVVKKSTCESLLASSFSAYLLSAILSLAILPAAASAADKVANFTMVNGNVDALREARNAPLPAEIGMDTYLQDIVRTKHRSRTQLKFIDNSILNMGSDYMLSVKEYTYDEENGIRRAILNSLRGTVRATVAKLGGKADSLFEIKTPTAVASVRGTDFIVKVNSDMETEVTVLEGSVAVRNINPGIKGSVLVSAGETTKISKNRAPSTPVYIPVEMIEVLINETTPQPGSKKKMFVNNGEKKKERSETKDNSDNYSNAKAGKKAPVNSDNGQQSTPPSNKTQRAARGKTKPTAQQAATKRKPAARSARQKAALSSGNKQNTPATAGMLSVAAPAPAFSLPIAPPPPPPLRLPSHRAQLPVMSSGHTTAAKALPPVQPPVTQVVPALITAPVAITLAF